jgi:hypothetical protein
LSERRTVIRRKCLLPAVKDKGFDTPDTSVVDEEEEAAAALEGCPPI